MTYTATTASSVPRRTSAPTLPQVDVDDAMTDAGTTTTAADDAPGVAAGREIADAPSASTPRSSWIVIFLDGERFIDQAIASIVAQRGVDDWEIVLVDDGSTDASTEIARGWAARDPERIRYVEHPRHENRGMSASRNAGVRHARGDVVGFLDCDDVLLPDSMARALGLLDDHPDVDVVIGRTLMWSSWSRPHRPDLDRAMPHPGGVEVGVPLRPTDLYRAYYGTPRQWTVPGTCSIVMRRSALAAIGGFDERFSGMFEDQVVYAKLALHLTVLLDDSLYALYRQHPRSAVARHAGWNGWYPWRVDEAEERFLTWLEDHVVRGFGSESPEADVVRANLVWRQDLSTGLREMWWTARMDAMDRLPVRASDGLRRLKSRWTGRSNRAVDVIDPDERRHIEGWTTGLVRVADEHGPVGADGADGDVGAFDRLSWAVQSGVRRAAPARLRSAVRRVRGFDGPAVGAVRFGDLRRTTPIADDFGYDRGGPVDRYYIERFLEDHRADIRGRCLEVGDAEYTLRFGADTVERADVLHVDPDAPGATFVGDLADGEFLPGDAFDCIVLTQTLHLVYDFTAALRTIERILAPGGVLLMTVPGISNSDPGEWGPTWHYGFTHRSVTRMCDDELAGCDVSLVSYGNVLAAVAFLHGLSAQELTPAELDEHHVEYSLIHAVRAVRRRPG